VGGADLNIREKGIEINCGVVNLIVVNRIFYSISAVAIVTFLDCCILVGKTF
jgi:hypothetical protein